MKHHDNELASAEYADVSRALLRKLRRLRLPPRYFKCGTRIVYRRSDIDAWLESQAVEPASPEEPATEGGQK